MKKINSFKYMLMAAVASLATTGCVEETFPEGGTATQEQVGASAMSHTHTSRLDILFKSSKTFESTREK